MFPPFSEVKDQIVPRQDPFLSKSSVKILIENYDELLSERWEIKYFNLKRM